MSDLSLGLKSFMWATKDKPEQTVEKADRWQRSDGTWWTRDASGNVIPSSAPAASGKPEQEKKPAAPAAPTSGFMIDRD